MKNVEQSSEVKAKENLPIAESKNIHIPIHVVQCIELTTVSDNEFPNVKCFYGIDGSTFLGVVIVETTDSFLVGASIKLIMGPDKIIRTDPISGEPIIRVMKTGIKFVTTASLKSLYFYYTFLLQEGRQYLPEYLTDEHMKNILEYVGKYRFKEDLSATEYNHSEPKIEVPGASRYGFIPLHISEEIH